MPRKPLPYACSACGVRYPKWMGRCAECGAWHSVQEDLERYGPRVVRLHGDAPPRNAAPAAPTPRDD